MADPNIIKNEKIANYLEEQYFSQDDPKPKTSKGSTWKGLQQKIKHNHRQNFRNNWGLIALAITPVIMVFLAVTALPLVGIDINGNNTDIHNATTSSNDGGDNDDNSAQADGRNTTDNERENYVTNEFSSDSEPVGNIDSVITAIQADINTLDAKSDFADFGEI